MPAMFWGIIVLTALGLITARFAYLWGKCEGIEIGWNQGDVEIVALEKLHISVIAGIEMALQSLSAGEIVAARTTSGDKITALLSVANRKATKEEGDAKAVAAEHQA